MGVKLALMTIVVILATTAGLDATTSIFSGALSVPRQDDTLEWFDDYDEALRLSRETGRPLLVEFRCAP